MHHHLRCGRLLAGIDALHHTRQQRFEAKGGQEGLQIGLEFVISHRRNTDGARERPPSPVLCGSLRHVKVDAVARRPLIARGRQRQVAELKRKRRRRERVVPHPRTKHGEDAEGSCEQLRRQRLLRRRCAQDAGVGSQLGLLANAEGVEGFARWLRVVGGEDSHTFPLREGVTMSQVDGRECGVRW